ncbi:hypothetical protein LAZ67_11000948 [Cordylochernes scorpioides]|uniref:Uncharacterized protein n=1 Tax=Cordylochernes scorpioides TaxID=51811 RepID=A0ABY6L0W2_9ARAC|nr:hypothetical protein LAZ67_11000948 [Cordylochernes scorpioides]
MAAASESPENRLKVKAGPWGLDCNNERLKYVTYQASTQGRIRILHRSGNFFKQIKLKNSRNRDMWPLTGSTSSLLTCRSSYSQLPRGLAHLSRVSTYPCIQSVCAAIHWPGAWSDCGVHFGDLHKANPQYLIESWWTMVKLPRQERKISSHLQHEIVEMLRGIDRRYFGSEDTLSSRALNLLKDWQRKDAMVVEFPIPRNEVYKRIKINPGWRVGTVQILPQPPYSPNIAPNDFFLFPKLESVLKGRHFDTRDDIIEKSLLALKNILIIYGPSSSQNPASALPAVKKK